MAARGGEGASINADEAVTAVVIDRLPALRGGGGLWTQNPRNWADSWVAQLFGQCSDGAAELCTGCCEGGKWVHPIFAGVYDLRGRGGASSSCHRREVCGSMIEHDDRPKWCKGWLSK